ncbi:hypothetical protein ONZ43_g1048 [Nemania bipapillata]|uniref:Uncharacterized protein n=1 Tax=Nemania bipapillata TaxID=110536 RepID=A0ACC2J5T6_9PEZI|nr:hypothetical protein ONZ43_g1048 [Nemania bipapillata]
MADPFSLTGTAVGIVSLGIQVAQSLYNYYTALKSQDSDIAYTRKKLNSLLEILDCLNCIQELQDDVIKFEKTPVDSNLSIAKSTARRLAYPFRKSTLEKLGENIDEIIFRLKLALQLLQQEVTDHIHDEIEDVKALLKLVRTSQISSELQDWLKAPDATINFNEVHKKKHPRTGLWLVKGPVFHAWLEICPSTSQI